MFLSRGDRDLGVAFQTHPGRQAFISSGSKEPRAALESRANLNAAAFLGDTGVRFVTVTGNAVIAKNAFEGSGLKQLTVMSRTFRLPNEFVYDIQSGITVVCSEDSELAAQLSGSDFADANITVVYPAE